MSMGRRKRHNAWEQDAFSKYWRRYIGWRPRALKEIKRGAHKRERAIARREIDRETRG